MAFVQVPDWVVRHCSGDLDAYCVLKLCLNRKTGACFPAIAHVAEALNCSIPTAERKVRRLKRAGAVRVIARKGGTNLYEFPENAPARNAPIKIDGGVPSILRGGSHQDPHQVCTENEHSSLFLNQRNQRGQKSHHSQSFPHDFQPDETNLKIARERGVNLEDALAQFTDYHRAKGSTFTDWHAALNSWLRRERSSAKVLRFEPAIHYLTLEDLQ
jgi:hypothetical protein